MSCKDHEKMNPVAHALYHVKEWDKKIAKKFCLALHFNIEFIFFVLNSKTLFFQGIFLGILGGVRDY